MGTKKRKGARREEAEVCVNGRWCGLFMRVVEVAICLCLEKTSRTRKD